MNLRKIILKLHFLLGFSSGIVIFIVSITGCLYAFEDEIQNLYKHYRFVNPSNAPFLAPSRLKAIAEDSLNLNAVRVYFEGTNRAAIVRFYKEDSYFYEAYLNPYTGKILKVENVEDDFFNIVLKLHYSLLLPYETGAKIVDYATLIFLIMMITGLILWWPRNKNGIRQRFVIKLNARWRRINFDLHSVLGFYITWISVFIVITGLAWGFKWVDQTIYFFASGGMPFTTYEEPRIDPSAPSLELSDKLYYQLMKKYPDSKRQTIVYPENDSSGLQIRINPDGNLYFRTNYFYFHPSSGALLKEDLHTNRNNGEKLQYMYYDIHVGKIAGFPGQLLAFFAGLIGASLPVTGVFLWIGRKNKRKKPTFSNT